MKVGDLFVRIQADSTDFKKGVREAESAADKFGTSVKRSMERAADSFKRLGETLATLFVFDKLKDAGGDIIKLAMAAEGSEATFKQVFGNMTEDARKFSNELSKTFGVNAIAMRKNMSTVDAIVKGMGLGDKTALDMSKGIAQMTYDLAAFKDLSIEDAFYKLRAGLTGETEPLKEVGILTTEEILKQVAYRKGIAKTGAELTEQQKVLARYAAIQESLTVQGGAGQWIREQSSASQQLKMSRERYEQLAGTVGQKLLPVLTKLLNIVNFALDKFSKLPDSVQTGVLWFGVAVVAAIGLTITLGFLGMAVSSIATAFGLLATAGRFVAGAFTRIFGLLRVIVPVISRLNPWIALATILIGIGANSEWARKKVEALWSTIKGFLGFQTASAQGTDSQSDSVDAVTKSFTDYIDAIGGVTDGLKDAGKASDKFLASFDEVYSIPDKADGLASVIPQLPTPPTPPTSDGGSGGGDSAGGESWIDKLLAAIAKIPKSIDMPTPNPPDGGASAVVTGIDSIIAKLSELPTPIALVKGAWEGLVETFGKFSPKSTEVDISFSTLLSNMTAKWLESSPILIIGLAALKFAMDELRPKAGEVKLSWSEMLDAMHAKIAEMNPKLATELQKTIDKLKAFDGQTVDTTNAWHSMLDTMQSDVNAYEPYLSWGLALIGISLIALHPQMKDTEINWHAMLDYLQSQINAYEPYISWGIVLIGLSLLGLSGRMTGTEGVWSEAWGKMYEGLKTYARPILEMIRKMREELSSLQAQLGKPIKVPNIVLPEIKLPEVAKKYIETFKQLDYGKIFSESTKSLVEVGLTSIPVIKGGQAAGAAGKTLLPKLKEIFEGMMQGGSKAIPGFATGGIIGSESIVRVGERNKREAIIPLESGAMRPFASAIADEMGGNSQPIVLQVGTLIGDERSYKELERRLRTVRIADQSRGDDR